MEILRHFLRSKFSIEIHPLDWQSESSWGFGSLGILRASKHFSNVSLGILYGENTFALQGKIHYVRAEWEHFPTKQVSVPPESNWSLTFNAQLNAKDFENTRWSILKDMPRDVRFHVSSLDCLDLISQTTPGQERLRKLRVEMSHHLIKLFMEGLVTQILKRLQALQSVELIVNNEDWMSISARRKLVSSRFFDHDFLHLIKNELAHIKTVTTQCHNADDGAYPWVSEQLQKRNRAWTPPLPGINRFWRTTRSMTALHPVVLADFSISTYPTRLKVCGERDSTRQKESSC